MEIKLINKNSIHTDSEIVKCIISNPETNDSFEIDLPYAEYVLKKKAYKLLKNIPAELKQEYLDLLDTIKNTTFSTKSLHKIHSSIKYYDWDEIEIPECDVFLEKMKHPAKRSLTEDLIYEYRMIFHELAENNQ